MASLQYIIDSICSKVTVPMMHRIVESRLAQGPFDLVDIIPEVQKEDRSLDFESARQIAVATVAGMAETGAVRVAGDRIFPAA